MHEVQQLNSIKESSHLAVPHEDVIRTAGISKIFVHDGVEVQAFCDVTLNIPRGQMIAVMGPSGSGKSSLLRCVNRLEEYQEGKVIFDGIDPATTTEPAGTSP